MNTCRKESLTVVDIIVLVSLIVVTIANAITVAIAITTGYTQTNITYPLFLSIVAVLFSFSVIYIQVTRSNRQEEIRLIEKSLENFYIPLQNLFIVCEQKPMKQNPMDIYQKQKTKFLEIGCYRHLAEKDAFKLFDECQDEESLQKLIDQVRKDINMLQNKYKEKK